MRNSQKKEAAALQAHIAQMTGLDGGEEAQNAARAAAAAGLICFVFAAQSGFVLGTEMALMAACFCCHWMTQLSVDCDFICNFVGFFSTVSNCY